MAKGVIYITTTSVRGLIKIGKTRTDQYESRMNNLEQNGYWNVSGLKRFYAVEVDDYDEKEKLMHKIFSKSQVANSELFALDTDLAKEMLDSFEGICIYPKQPSNKKDISKPVSTKQKNNTPIIPRKTNLTFEMLGIQIGSVLEFCRDSSVKVTTTDNKNKVSYNGQVYGISTLAAKLINQQTAQGGMYFKYNGKLLTVLRKEKGL